MQSKRGKARDPHIGSGDQHLRGLTQAWNELSKARRELRRMENRIGDTRIVGESSGPLGAGVAGSSPNTRAAAGSCLDQTYLVNNVHSFPTARFVDSPKSSSSTRVSSRSPGAKRKVSHFDDKAPPAHSASASSRSRQRRDRNTRSLADVQSVRHAWSDNVAGESTGAALDTHHPRRVDFSERLRLREVRWDGTYQDKVAHNAQPLTYPYYTGNSLNCTDCESQSQSTLTDSRALRETEIRFLNDTYVTDPFRQQNRNQTVRQRQQNPRLTHVDVDLPGARAKASGERGHADGLDSKGNQDTRTRRSYGVLLPADRAGDMSGREKATEDMDSSSTGDSEKGVLSGSEGSSRSVSSRMQKIKKSLKDLPQHENILSKLREKIRQQRLSASSTDSSQNDSLIGSLPNSESSRDVTPQHILHGAQEPVRLEDHDILTPEKIPRTRKVTTGPPIPTYRGFSEAHLDPHLQATIKQVNRLTAPKRKSEGSQKSSDPMHSVIPVQLKTHHHTLSTIPAFASTPVIVVEEKPKKAPRIVAQCRRPSKFGAKTHQQLMHAHIFFNPAEEDMRRRQLLANSADQQLCDILKAGFSNLITTSSWRAGQELVARELGLSKHRNREEVHRTVAGSSCQDDQRRPDGAEGNVTDCARVPVTGANLVEQPSETGTDYSMQLAQSRTLSDDAKNVFHDLQQNNNRTPVRSAVKRKAPKVEREVEKPESAEKHRHYDSESVRQYMAKQKAERQRRREELRKAEEQEQQKRQKLMQELIMKQKSVVTTAPSIKAKKTKYASKGNQLVLFPPDQHSSVDQQKHNLLKGDSDKENSELQKQKDGEDNDDSDNTLTDESEEGSTPRATPVNVREDPVGRPGAYDYNSESNFHSHSGLRFDTNSITVAAVASSLPTSQQQSYGGTIEFQGKKLDLDVNSVLLRFSKVLKERQAQNGEAFLGKEISGFQAGTRTISPELTKRVRLQMLKTSAKDLQNKISSASAEICKKHDAQSELTLRANSDGEFIPRYERIAGSRDNFQVFTSDLPGVQNGVARTSSNDMIPISGVQATAQKSSMNSMSAPGPLTFSSLDQGADDDYSVTETSTFSEVTAADESEHANSHRTKPLEVGQGNAARSSGAGDEHDTQYIAPAGGNFQWENPRSDPYSVFNIFSRQQRFGTKAAFSADRSGNSVADNHVQQPDAARLKDPKFTSSQQVMFGKTAEGHPVMARTTYTRLEATIEDRSQGSQPLSSNRNKDTRSEGQSERIYQTSFPSRILSLSEDTLESEEDELRKAPSSKKSLTSLKRQMSDTGQETDVSQLSEDEPRISVKLCDRPILEMSHHEAGDARFSPSSLERQMTAELARLESLEDSIRQLTNAERTRAVALAQQETVSVAQVLKARQQAHSAELRSLHLQVQEERLASAQQLQQQLSSSKGVQAPTSDISSFLSQPDIRHTANKQLQQPVENQQHESKFASSLASHSKSHDETEYTETFTSVLEGKPALSQPFSHATPQSAVTKSSGSLSVKTAEDGSLSVKTAEDSSHSIKTAEDSVKTAEDSDISIKTASDADRHSPDVSAVAEEMPDGDYSLSFDESMTEDESFKQQSRPSNKSQDAKSRKHHSADGGSSYRMNDLASMFGGEDSFNRFNIDIVRNILREEEMRSQHQESLLRLRMKAVKKKTKTQLSLLQQEKKRQLVKCKEVAPSEAVQQELKRLANEEKAILKEQEEQQAEISRMFRAEELAREHRQSLLRQHEQIAKMQEETRQKLKLLQSQLGQSVEIPTDDETSLMEDFSDASDVSYTKDSKSDSEVMQRNKTKMKGDKQKLEKQQKLRLDQKYLTVREQKLVERKKQASELLRWKRDLDAEEEKVLQLEHSALRAWEGQDSDKPSLDIDPGTGTREKNNTQNAKREDTESKVKIPGSRHPEAAEAVVTPRTARSESGTTPESVVDSYASFRQSEAVSTHISAYESDQKRSRTDRSENFNTQSRVAHLQSSQASSSIAEVIPDGSEVNQPMSSPDRQLDSSDDTIINSSVNEDEETDGCIHSKGKKSSVGRLLPPGNSPLPQPWSRKTGFESESEESVSHTETQSDASDYEVRIRQLSDMLRRRRKEAEMLKKERSKRMKEKLRAQEESLKKQLEAYDMYIARVKSEQADLELEGGKPTVPPKIKQPHAGKNRSSPSSSPSPSRHQQRDDPSYSSSFEGTDSNQTSPALSEGKSSTLSPPADKGKKVSSSIMDRISEASETQSDRSRQDASKGLDKKVTPSLSDGSISDTVEEAVDSVSAASDSSHSPAFNIKTSDPAKADLENKVEENQSYSQEFSQTVSKLLPDNSSKMLVSVQDASQVSELGFPSSEVSERIQNALSNTKSSSSAELDPKVASIVEKENSISAAAATVSSRPATGIQESDSESESRINSHRTLSRPSSERSTGSTTYSDLHDLDVEEDIISSESDRTPTPVKVSVSQKEKSSSAQVVKSEDISEQISARLPSVNQVSTLRNQGSLHSAVDDLFGEDDATPTQSPRIETPPLDQEESSDTLLKTDPLADFNVGEQVLVGGDLFGILRFKGAVSFAPGFWAGVELTTAEGDSDGQRDGKRYFTCQMDHGVLVPGSEISSAEEERVERVKPTVDRSGSPDESLTDHEGSSATEDEKSDLLRHETGQDSPTKEKIDEQLRASISTTSLIRGQNLDGLADDITAHLTESLMEDSMHIVNSIVSRHSPSHPVKKTPPPTLPKPKLSNQQQAPLQWTQELKEESQKQTVDRTTSAVVGTLLDDAISKMMQIRLGRSKAMEIKDINGYSDDSGVDPSHDSSLDPALGGPLEPESGNGEAEELKRPMSPEPFSRPRSPVPVISLPEEEQDDDYDFSGLLGDDQEFFDDEQFGISAKPPPPYPGVKTKGADSSTSSSKLSSSTDLFIVPHERSEVDAIVASAVEIFWNMRRCGEPWESATPPKEYLAESGSPKDSSEQLEGVVSSSRQTFRHLIFDLTGEIVRDIYQNEEDVEPPAWQKPQQKRHRYFKGPTLPMTKDALLPVVQSTITDILGLNGCSGRFRGKVANKWNVRKKKDHVDAVLVEELHEEEADWISYDRDELAVKMQLTDTIFDSLLMETVTTLNKVYSKRHHHLQTS